MTMFILHSYRFFGQAKLTKPKELSGRKPTLSVDYIPKKCRCPVYLVEDDAWIRHRDYFSNTLNYAEFGAPLEVLAKKYLGNDRNTKFTYSDSWGAIVLRNEAWICLRGLIADVRSKVSPLKLRNTILRQQEARHGWEMYELECSDMDRFYESLIWEVTRYVRQGDGIERGKEANQGSGSSDPEDEQNGV